MFDLPLKPLLHIHFVGGSLFSVLSFRFSFFLCVLPLFSVFSLVIFFVVVRVVNPFHKHFAVVYFGCERIFQKFF